MPVIDTAQLLVEGKDDLHVIKALCEKYEVPETFSVEIPGGNNGGDDPLLKSIPVRLKIPGLRALGIVLDADQNLNDRWNAICARLTAGGYSELPDTPSSSGSIIEIDQKPRVGIWLMPNNQLPGKLEDFVSYLIPDDDLLAPKADYILQEIEGAGLNKYSLAHHQKAFIHTWLAWQENPGQPMGTAITVQALRYDQPLAQDFIQWLNLLFQ